MCGTPLYTNDKGVSLTKEGFPKRFLYLKEYIDSKDYKNLRAVMSLISYSRSIKPTREEEEKQKLSSKLIDFSTITKPYTGKNYSIPLYFIKE